MLTEVDLKEKTRHQPPTPCNAFSHVALVTYLTRNLEDMLQHNKLLIAQVKAQMKEMQTTIEYAQNQIQTIFTPALTTLWETLQNKTEQQKIENVNLQQQITDLKRQKAVLSQMVSQTDRKAKDVKEQIGGY